MSNLIHPLPFVKLKVKRVNSTYQKLYNQIQALEQARISLELEILNVDKQISQLNQQLDQLEEEVLKDLSRV